jgi:hypothetical protein
MQERSAGKPTGVMEGQSQGPARKDGVRPSRSWKLDYYEEDHYFVVRDEEGKLYTTITGESARMLERILASRNPRVTYEMVDAYRPLVLEVFKGESGLDGEDQSWADEIAFGQPRIHDLETSEEVYRRYWTGHLMPNKITARDVAEKIIKSEDRFRVALALGNVTRGFMNDKIGELASVIREYHPNGSKGK